MSNPLTQVLPSSVEIASFRFHPTNLEAIGDPTFEQWLACGAFLKEAGGAVHFWIGDWLNYGEFRWGDTYREATALTGFDIQTLRNDKWVASRVEVSRRRDALSFEHHKEVADVDAEEQGELLSYAEEKQMNAKTFRGFVNERNMKFSDDKVSRRRDTSDEQSLVKTALASGIQFLKDLQRLETIGLSEDDNDQLSEIIRDIADVTSTLLYENRNRES